MEYFGINEEELSARGGLDTAREIWNQPYVWGLTFQKIIEESRQISDFWNIALKNSRKIILTGAGTSAYIGYSLEGTFMRNTGISTVSIPTTHLVTHPKDYFQPDLPVLIISFARSGNSPESVAVMKLADSICKSCYHLVITCDKDGALANYKSANGKYSFVLPEESNDHALAMTSSYTGMLFAGLLISRIDKANSLRDQVITLKEYGNKILKGYSDKLKEIAELEFERVVFLGSGPLYGTSTESHLKLQELSDGQVICKNDTFLAFRHGPKAVVNEKTVIVMLFSNNEQVQRYERDFVASLGRGKRAMLQVGVSEEPIAGMDLDVSVIFSEDGKKLDEEFLAICSVMPAQILGLFKSLNLGLKPDNPSTTGAISRVVEGVKIYDF
ncbi:MAG: SIS domain-containing protein [Bacteroidales bacterium]